MLDRFRYFQSLGLKLDLTRGKPGPAQLDMLGDFPSAVSAADLVNDADGIDIRNYGGDIAGLPGARELFGCLLGAPSQTVLAWNNSSLELMGDLLDMAMHCGIPNKIRPWAGQGKVRGIVLVPGYDRHMNLSASLGVELTPVRLTEDGGYLDEVERLVGENPEYKMAWVVPRFSNPSGLTMTPEQVRRCASTSTASPDFLWFVDNAYAVHALYPQVEPRVNIFQEFSLAGRIDHLLLFASTAKIVWPGCAVGAVATSRGNHEALRKRFGARSIGPSKYMQLLNVRFIERFPGGLDGLMCAHAELLRPRFEAVLEVFDRELGGTGLATWSRPTGGYFINLDTKPGSAKAIVELAGRLGVKLTPAGSTWPGGADPEDSNIRIAPTFPSVDEVRLAAEVVAFAVSHLCREPEPAE